MAERSEKTRNRERSNPDSARLVMVVEDSEDIRELLTLVLEEEGYRVIAVADGTEAVEAARRDRPDLITLDLALPGKDGWQVLRELHESEQTRDIPVLVISAYTREMEPPLRRRASSVIPKPFYITQVAAEVSDLLKGRGGGSGGTSQSSQKATSRRRPRSTG